MSRSMAMSTPFPRLFARALDMRMMSPVRNQASDQGREPLRPSVRLLVHDEEHRREGGRTRDVGDGERHDEGLEGDLLADGSPRPRKHHPDRDEEEHRSSRGPERGFRDMERAQDVLSREEKDHEDEERDHELADDDPTVPLPRHVLKGGDEERNVAERVENEEQENRGGEEGHGSSVHGEDRDLRALALDADDFVGTGARSKGNRDRSSPSAGSRS